MVDWRSIIDEQLKRLTEVTKPETLPGAGKPLNLSENPYTPGEMRMAHRILKENDLEPDWISEGRELDVLRGKLIDRIQHAVRQGEVTEKLRADIAACNKRILTYNLKVPAGVQHKLAIHLERETRRK